MRALHGTPLKNKNELLISTNKTVKRFSNTYSILVYGISFNCSSDNPDGSTSSFLEGNKQENKSC